MKAILSTLLISFALGELPPPYSQRGFRPSPQFFPGQQPQTQYGPPKLQSNNIDVNIPSKLTIEQLIRLTERLQNSHTKNSQINQLSRPQSSYSPPPRQPQNTYGPPSKFSQNQLRPPHISQQSFRPSNGPQNNFINSQPSGFPPQTSYGTPSKVTFSLSNNVLQSQNQHFGSNSPQGVPQTTYGVPEVQQLPHPSQPGASNNHFNPQTPPSTSYGVPDLKSIETLGDLRKQQLPNREPTGFAHTGTQTVAGISQQYLPANAGSQNAAGGGNQNIPQSSGFGGAQGSSQGESQNIPSVNQQYLPASTGNNFGQRPQNAFGNSQAASNPNGFGISSGGSANPNFPSGGSQFGNTGEVSTPNGGGPVNNVGNNYLPPQTTPRPVASTTTIKPRAAGTTPATPEGTTNYDYDYDLQQPMEASSNDDESAAGPNVSISNAVAGPGGFFYLQQPDGRLQKVVLQKTQEPNSKPEEYVANYYFQNIQQLPTVTYAPLISLGAWK